jgi:hypothetical protein
VEKWKKLIVQDLKKHCSGPEKLSLIRPGKSVTVQDRKNCHLFRPGKAVTDQAWKKCLYLK